MILNNNNMNTSPTTSPNNNNNNSKSTNNVLAEQAQRHYKNGVILFREKHYKESIVEFKKSLVIRESIYGRYDLSTASQYACIGACYYQLTDYDNAIISCRPWLRIRRYVLSKENATNDATKTPTTKNTSSPSSSPSSTGGKPLVILVQAQPTIKKYTRIRQSLKKKGFTDGQIKLYDSNLNTSLQHELDGDQYRDNGEYIYAIEEYKEAIAIENNCVGNEITLAYLWRKIKFLMDQLTASSGSSSSLDMSNANNNKNIDFNQVDLILQYHKPTKKQIQENVKPRLVNTNLDPNPYGLSESILDAIQRGDMYHCMYEYGKALESYRGDSIDMIDDDDDDDDEIITAPLNDTAPTPTPRTTTKTNQKKTAGFANEVTTIPSGPAAAVVTPAVVPTAATPNIVLQTSNIEKSIDNKLNDIQNTMMARLDTMIQSQMDMIGRYTTNNIQLKDDITKHLDIKLLNLECDMKKPLTDITTTQHELLSKLSSVESNATAAVAAANNNISQNNRIDKEQIKSELLEQFELKLNAYFDTNIKTYVDSQMNTIQESLLKQFEEQLKKVQVDILDQVQQQQANSSNTSTTSTVLC